MSVTIPALGALLQLASPALPVGAFSYSSGLEAAVEHRIVADAASAHAWIRDGLHEVLGRTELPLLHRFHCSWRAGQRQTVADWNAWYLASRESIELRHETEQMGWSLVQLLGQLAWGSSAERAWLETLRPVAFPCAYAFAIAAIDLGYEAGATGFCYSWVENQVLAAIKAVPLGQSAGQRILAALSTDIASVVTSAAGLADDRIVAFAPQLGVLSSRHAFQYSRIFRS
ncbi:MAG: urease accessory protein UreF [Verrucomicrobia bacterium]|nr:urease accessory protein UreF [Verrucomicrobiota bacterium]